MSLRASDLYAIFMQFSPALAHTERARTQLWLKYSNGLNIKPYGVFRGSHFKILIPQSDNEPCKEQSKGKIRKRRETKRERKESVVVVDLLNCRNVLFF